MSVSTTNRPDPPSSTHALSERSVLGGLFKAVRTFAVTSPQNALALALVTVVLAVVLASLSAHLLGTTLTEAHPTKMNVRDRLSAPSAEYWMGTDKIGRDLFARLVAGAWITVSVSFVVLLVASLVGTTVGLVAGFYGGWIDEVLMRITDLFLAFPALILAAAIAATFGGGLVPTTVALAAVFWPWYARLVRSRVLSLKSQAYVEAVRAMGGSDRRILFVTLLPLVWPLVLIQASTDVGFVMLASSGLSFLGLGAQPPTPEWGAMIFDGLTHQPRAWWLVLFPGAAIAFVAIAFNLLGDALRDYADPALGASEAGV